ncbi:fimbrial protein [Klebsiella pneumoniae]|nr:fimbrial protein [Klebsiella pneumoniae]
MKYIILYCSLFVSLIFSPHGRSFTCKVTDTGKIITSGSANVKVMMAPTIGVNENLVVDLSSSIVCKNDSRNGSIVDYVNLDSGTTFGGALNAFDGSVYWAGNFYTLPMTSNSSVYAITQTSYQGLPLRMYLKATGAAGGVAIHSGELIAQLNMHKVASDGNPRDFIWYIYANNDVVVPTGGCDVSARNVTVTLPDYPGTVDIPLTVHCAQTQKLSFYITGKTAGNSNTVFVNQSSNSPAGGVGIELMSKGNVLQTNANMPLGNVGTNPVSLGLMATYGLTGDSVTAGNVQSVINVTFLYE